MHITGKVAFREVSYAAGGRAFGLIGSGRTPLLKSW